MLVAAKAENGRSGWGEMVACGGCRFLPKAMAVKTSAFGCGLNSDGGKLKERGFMMSHI